MYTKYIGKLLPLALLFCFLLSCQTANFSGLPPESKSITRDIYTIGPEDILRIHVWKQPGISVTAPVRIDGRISIPLIQDIHAAGLTPDQLRDEIAEKLNRFVEEPTVSVIVEAINSSKISVSGNVKSAGIYKIGLKISLVEAISLAGGLTQFADPKKIRIIRKENSVEKLYQVDYKAILSGEIRQNIVVYPGDSIVVP